MKRLCMALVVVALVAPAAVRAEFALKDTDVVTFFGDGLVQNAKFPTYVESFIYARYPDLRAQILTDGRDNETPGDLLTRYEQEISKRPIKPTVAVLCYGAYLTGMKPLEDGEAAAFGDSLGMLVDRLKADGIQVVLMTPPSAEETRNRTLKQIDMNDKVLGPLSEQIKKVAQERNVPVADWFGKSTEVRDTRKAQSSTFSMTTDGLNPTTEGEALGATVLLDEWNADPIDVAVTLDWETGDVTTSAGSASAKKTDAGGYEIVLNEFPMPWPGFTGRGQTMSSEWYAAKLNNIMVTVKNIPEMGLMMGDERRKVPVMAQMLDPGMNFALVEPMTTLPDVAELWQYINTKNRLWIRLVKEATNAPDRTELQKAHDSLVDTYRLYYEGYCDILDKTPRRVSVAVTFDPLAMLTPPPPGDPRLQNDADDPAHQHMGDEGKKENLMKEE